MTIGGNVAWIKLILHPIPPIDEDSTLV